MTARAQPAQSAVAATSEARAPSTWSGWILFGAVMLVLNGLFTMVQGIVALVDEGYFLVRAGDRLLLADYKAWGTILLCWGALGFLAGVSLVSGRGWARWAGMLVAAVGVLVQMAFLSAYPVWSALAIGFDVIVIFALAAHWDSVQKL